MSLFDTYSDVSRATEEDKPKFFRLLEKHIDWEELIPPDFYWAFHKRMGRKRNKPYKSQAFLFRARSYYQCIFNSHVS
ncbi:MAG: hypothetical protein PHZ09_06425, partial [Eubacteriales bacterium]|nr:hypothetical protein [Eubacteriales bacterium]